MRAREWHLHPDRPRERECVSVRSISLNLSLSWKSQVSNRIKRHTRPGLHKLNGACEANWQQQQRAHHLHTVVARHTVGSVALSISLRHWWWWWWSWLPFPPLPPTINRSIGGQKKWHFFGRQIREQSKAEQRTRTPANQCDCEEANEQASTEAKGIGSAIDWRAHTHNTEHKRAPTSTLDDKQTTHRVEVWTHTEMETEHYEAEAEKIKI